MATRSGSRALLSSMVASRRSGLYNPHLSLPSESGPFVVLQTDSHRPEERLRPPELLPDGIGTSGAGGTLVLHASSRREQTCGHLRERGMRRRELLWRHILERDSQFLAPPDEPPDGVMGFAERNSLRREEIRELRRQGEPSRRPCHPS